MLDFSSLAKAIKSLAAALKAASSRPDDEFIRDASIQRFEYTYELCVRSLRRHLEAISDSPAEIDALGFRDMIRAGAERGLLKSEERWFGYRELRNITSHVYDPKKAAQVFNGLNAFLRDAKALHTQLRKGNR
jgi:nucleotidyltransferase substrate binding protein (TIGR01987 family)